MTLVLAAHNDRDIIVACDSMAILSNLETGEYEGKSFNAEKIYPIDKHSLIAMSGVFDYSAVDSFLRNFTYRARLGNYGAEHIFQALGGEAQHTLKLEADDRLRLLVAGYDDQQPILYSLHIDAQKLLNIAPMSNEYHAIGYEDPVKQAGELLKLAKFNAGVRTSDLRQTVQDIVTQSIIDFPDLVGGSVQTKVLRPPKK